MSASRRISGIALFVAVCVAVMGAAIAIAVLRSDGSNANATNLSLQSGPKAVVDNTSWDVGGIESGEEFGHTFVIRNDGDKPLQLTQGKGLCKCMVADVPDAPVLPGKQAKIKLVAADSVKKEPMTPGPFSRGLHVLTNDPDNPDLHLHLTATVTPRIMVNPSPVTLTIDSSQKSLSPQKRSTEAWVYSERWKGFELSAGKTSRKDVQWKIEPASREKLEEFNAQSGYRVSITLPSEMPEGRIAEWIDFTGKPAGGKDAAANGVCRLDIRGRVEGRLTFYSQKITDGDVLQLGAFDQGERVHETLLMKVKDEQRSFTVDRIETNPAFLRVRLVPHASGSKKVGLYRIEVEIPGDAPPCEFTGVDRGSIRVKTNHPRLPVIELRVDFVVTARNRGISPIAAR